MHVRNCRQTPRWVLSTVSSLAFMVLSIQGGRPAGTTRAQARATTPLQTVAWMDADQGTSVDVTETQNMRAVYDGSHWTLFTNGRVVASGSNGQPLFQGFWISAPQGRIFGIHGHLGTQLLNGTIVRDSLHSVTGTAVVTTSGPSAAGGTVQSVQVCFPLTFDPSQDAPDDTGPLGHF